MIHDHDRSGWFGASDTAAIMGRWDTKTFRSFWLQKLGVNRDHFSTLEMETGSAYEHRISESRRWTGRSGFDGSGCA